MHVFFILFSDFNIQCADRVGAGAAQQRELIAHPQRAQRGDAQADRQGEQSVVCLVVVLRCVCFAQT